MAPPRKLKMETVQLIRTLLLDGVTIGKLARDFRVSEGTIQAIKRGTAYREDEEPRVVRTGRPDWEAGRGIVELVDAADASSPSIKEVDATSSDADIAAVLRKGREGLIKKGLLK